MTYDEFYNWFHTKFLPQVQRYTLDDMRYYRDVVIDVLAFLTEVGSGYSYLNCACILAAWANENYTPSLQKFVFWLESRKVNYWDGHEDRFGLLPKDN